ncbi:ribonuclease P protein component [Anaerolineales bacterium]
MKQRNRLRRTDDFARVKQNGRIIRHPFILLSVLPNQLSYNRYGIVTGKRIGKAVSRNQVKRRIREILRLLHSNLKQGYDIVVIPHPTIVHHDFSEIQEAIKNLFQRAGLVDEESS